MHRSELDAARLAERLERIGAPRPNEFAHFFDRKIRREILLRDLSQHVVRLREHRVGRGEPDTIEQLIYGQQLLGRVQCMRQRVYDKFGAFVNELPVERLTLADLRAYQFTLTERLLCDPGGCDRRRAADERPEDPGHCTDDRDIHRVASAPGIANHRTLRARARRRAARGLGGRRMTLTLRGRLAARKAYSPFVRPGHLPAASTDTKIPCGSSRQGFEGHYGCQDQVIRGVCPYAGRLLECGDYREQQLRSGPVPDAE